MIARLEQPSTDELLVQLDNLQNEVESLHNQIEHLDRLATVGTLTACIAHEINNVLTPALNYAELAQRNPDNTELLHKAVRKAAVGLNSATRILRSTLDFSSPAAPARGETSRGCSTCNIRQVVDAAFECLARDPQRDGIECAIDLEDALDAAMEPIQLQQVVLNLILNAIAAMQVKPEAGVAERRLSIVAARERDGSIALRVSDTGCGLSPAARRELFAPFAVADHRAGGNDGQHGRGLGLAVCRMILERAGGEINVESTSSSGTTFIIHLP